MRIWCIARCGVVERWPNGECDRVSRVFDEVDNVAVMQSWNVMAIDGQDTIAHVKARATLSWTVANDLADKRNAFRNRWDDDKAKAFVFAAHHCHIVRVNAVAVIHARWIYTTIWFY